MPSDSLKEIVRQLRVAAGRDGVGPTDGELLTRFLNRRDEDAFAALVGRHAPMVWGVCRRLIHNPHDAEDAFQATFLVLVQKAATVVPREMVANWLHGVAQQTAVRLRSTAAKRGWREMQMNELPEPAVSDARDEELLSRLDEELRRLPERFRALIVLCDLEGQTRGEAARQLGCPEGTVASGLVRARERLAKRLTRSGLAVSGASLATTLSHSMASADVPATCLASTINVSTLLMAGKATGVISGPVATLTQGVLKTMFLKKIMTTITALALGVAVITGGSLAVGQAEGRQLMKEAKAPVAEQPVESAAKQEKEAFTAWGKEAGGLQAGLGFLPGRKRAYHTGENVTVVLRVRNVGKEEAKFSYFREEFGVRPPALTDDWGNPRPLDGFNDAGSGLVKRIEVTLAPGNSVDLSEMPISLRPASEKGKETPVWKLFGTGWFRLQNYTPGPNRFQDSKTGPDSILCKLATGKLEFEVKEPEKVLPGNEALTAWGKEVGGLQSGLGLPPGAKRVYQHGETVTLFVRVRNLGKEAVTFEYVRQFLDENRPVVTDAGGKAIPQSGTAMLGMHGPTEVTLKPGKEIVLETRMHGASGSPHALLPESGGVSSAKVWPLFVGTGKVGLQYERVIGNSSSGRIKLDPALSKLATGKLELEIGKSEPEVQPKPFAAPGREAGDAEKKSPPEQDRKAKAEVFTIKNVKIEDVDEKAGVVSVSFGDKQRPTRLSNLPLGKGVRVVASHVLPGVGNNLPFDWKRVDGLKGRIVSIRLMQVADRLEVVSIAFGND